MDPEMKITLDSSNENLPIYPNNNNPVHNANTSNQKINSNNKKRKADVWNFFTQEDGIAVCRCSKVYKYQSTNGTSTLRHHAMKCSMCPDFPGNDSSNQNDFGGTIKQTIPDYKPVYKTQQRKSGSFQSSSGLQMNDHLMNTIPDQMNSSGTVNVANTFPSIPFMMTTSKQVATAPKRPSYNVQMKTVRSLIELMFQENLSYQIVESRSFQQFMFNIKNDISAINKEILAAEMSKYLDYLHKTIEYNLQLNFPVAQQDDQLQSPMKANILTQNKCNLMVRLIYLGSRKGISRPYLAINISFIDDNWNLQNFLLSVANLNTDNVNNAPKNAFDETILSKEYLYHVVMKEIERFRLFPFIHSIQFDLQNYVKNMKMKQFFQLKWKELTDPNSSNSSNSAVPLILSPLPTNVVIDMLAIDLLSVLSSTNYLPMIRQIISFVHYSTPEQKQFYEWILWNSPELRTEFSDAKKAILDNCGLDYSLFSFYNKKINVNGEDEEGCSYLRNGSVEWERSYQMCTHFIHNLKVYQRYFHLQFNKINSSSAVTTAMEMFSPLIRRFHEFLSSYSSLDDWNELKNLYQLIDWCFHVKKNNLNIYKPLENNQKWNYATNHLLFHQVYDFNHYMKQIIHSTRTNTASVEKLKQLHAFYSNYLNIYDPSFKNGSENNRFFHSYSDDQEVYYITHLLDPRFRFNFLQELSINQSQKNRTAQTNEKTKYDDLSHQFTLLFMEYQQRYSRVLPENPLIDETAAQEMMNDLQGSSSEGEQDDDRNNDNEDEESNVDNSNSVQKRLSYNSLEQSPPLNQHHHQPAAAFHLNKTSGNESLHHQQLQPQQRPQRDSYSFGNTMASNWLKKKSLAMKYSYFDQLRNNQNHNDKDHDNYDVNDIYELNYYIKENQFFFHHLQHEKFHYQNYISHFYQRNTANASSFSAVTPSIQSSHQQQHQYDSFSMNQEAAVTTSINGNEIHGGNLRNTNSGTPRNPPIGPEFDLLSWWNEYSYQFPYLSIIARHYLSIPAMSTITNFVTGGDWMDDWLASSGQGSSHHGYELQSNEFFAPFGGGCGDGNDSLISDEFIRDLLLGHHWYNVIQRNQWKPPAAM
jgi:hypothetical protein